MLKRPSPAHDPLKTAIKISLPASFTQLL